MRTKKEAVKRLGKPVEITIKGKTYYRVRLGKRFTHSDQMISKTFKSEAEAKTFLEQQETMRLNQGLESLNLKAKLRVQALEATKLLAQGLPGRKPPTLEEVVQDYLNRKAPEGAVTVKAACDSFIVDRKSRCSHRYIVELEGQLNRFVEKFGKRMFHTLTKNEIQDWINTKGPSNKTKNGYRTTLQAVYNFGLIDGNLWCGENPVSLIKAYPESTEAPQFLKVPQVIKLLRGAEEHDRDLLPFLCLGLFTGMRRSEILCLRWKDVDFDSGTIYVSGSIAKTSDWRNAFMPENLSKWLAPFRQKDAFRFVVPFANNPPPGNRKPTRTYTPEEERLWRCGNIEGHRRRDLLAKIEFGEWPENALRHSAATYLFALWEDMGRVTTALGHGADVSKENYRGRATKAEAEKYFAILPDAEMGKKVVAFAAAK